MIALGLLLASWQRPFTLSTPTALVQLAVVRSGPVLFKELRLEPAVKLGFEWDSQLVLSLGLSNCVCLFLVLLHMAFLLLQVEADLELVLNEVLCLGKAANEFVALFLSEFADLGSVDDLLPLQLLLLPVQLLLPVD